MKRTVPVNVGRKLMFFFLCLYSIGIFAQNIDVTGHVTDENNEPLIGVTVKVLGESEKGTVTDFDGKFILPNIPSDAKIEVSYVGMQKQVIDVNNRKVIDIVLKEDSEILEEVVVVGYGIQKKASVTAAISSVDTKSLKQSSSANLSAALAGRLPGLTAMQTRIQGYPF